MTITSMLLWRQGIGGYYYLSLIGRTRQFLPQLLHAHMLNAGGADGPAPAALQAGPFRRERVL